MQLAYKKNQRGTLKSRLTLLEKNISKIDLVELNACSDTELQLRKEAYITILRCFFNVTFCKKYNS